MTSIALHRDVSVHMNKRISHVDKQTCSSYFKRFLKMPVIPSSEIYQKKKNIQSLQTVSLFFQCLTPPATQSYSKVLTGKHKRIIVACLFNSICFILKQGLK